MSLSFFYSLRPTLGRKILNGEGDRGLVDDQKHVKAPSMTKSEPVVKVAASLAR